MLIDVDGLGFRFAGRPFLWRNIALSVCAGEVLAVLGPNGTGKTTFIKALVGLLSPTEGEVRRAGPVGYVPQMTQLAFSYLVRDVVAMGRARHIGLLGTLRTLDIQAVENAIEEIGIAELIEREFAQLSGGQRQLVLIARALASESPIIVLDEPMSSLDLRNQRRMLALFGKLARNGKAAIIFSTHNPEHAFRVATNVLLLGENRAPQTGSVPACLSEQALSNLYGVDMRIVEIRSRESVTRHAVPIL